MIQQAPDRPPVTRLPRLMPARHRQRTESEHSNQASEVCDIWSRLPRIRPTRIATAHRMLCRNIGHAGSTHSNQGQEGPSLIFRMAWAAMSVSSPKVPARDMNRPPLELVTALMMAR